jgi:isopentenyl phosphate kinase
MKQIKPKVIIKVGGSIIAGGRTPCTFHDRIAKRLVLEIREADVDFILVHGAGSFGHNKSKRYGLDRGHDPRRDDQVEGLSEVQHDMRTLNLKIIKLLYRYGIPAGMVAPATTLQSSNKKIKKMDYKPFETYIQMGVVPVTFGDVVQDEKIGFSIVSGDDLMVKLARHFEIKHAIFVTDVDGVLSGPPSSHDVKVMPVIKSRKDLPKFKGATGKNVTFQMEGKTRCALKMAANGTEVRILNGTRPDRLRDALMNRKVVCTVFPAKKKPTRGAQK